MALHQHNECCARAPLGKGFVINCNATVERAQRKLLWRFQQLSSYLIVKTQILLSFYAKCVHAEKHPTPFSPLENCISANNGTEYELRRPSQLPPWLQNSVQVIAEISRPVLNFLTLDVYSKNNTNLSVSLSVEDIVSLWTNYSFDTEF